jgi:hypothetical protein
MTALMRLVPMILPSASMTPVIAIAIVIVVGGARIRLVPSLETLLSEKWWKPHLLDWRRWLGRRVSRVIMRVPRKPLRFHAIVSLEHRIPLHVLPVLSLSNGQAELSLILRCKVLRFDAGCVIGGRDRWVVIVLARQGNPDRITRLGLDFWEDELKRFLDGFLGGEAKVSVSNVVFVLLIHCFLSLRLGLVLVVTYSTFRIHLNVIRLVSFLEAFLRAAILEMFPIRTIPTWRTPTIAMAFVLMPIATLVFLVLTPISVRRRNRRRWAEAWWWVRPPLRRWRVTIGRWRTILCRWFRCVPLIPRRGRWR